MNDLQFTFSARAMVFLFLSSFFSVVPLPKSNMNEGKKDHNKLFKLFNVQNEPTNGNNR